MKKLLLFCFVMLVIGSINISAQSKEIKNRSIVFPVDKASLPFSVMVWYDSTNNKFYSFRPFTPDDILSVTITGGATSAKQDTGITYIKAINTKLGGTLTVTGTFWQDTQPVSGTFWQAIQPVSVSSLPLPTGAATSSNQSTQITRVDSLIARLSLILDQLNNELSVALPTGASSSALQDSVKNRIIETMAYLNSLVTNTTGLGTSANQSTQITRSDSLLARISLLLDQLNNTLAISAASLPLPSDASTATNQATHTTRLDSLLARTSLVLDQLNNTLAISVASLPLPSGASTEIKQDSTNAVNDRMLTELSKKADDASIDSVKNRIIELMAYQNSLKSKLDSLFAYTQSDSIVTMTVDSVNNTKDSVVTNFTKWVQWAVWADSNYTVAFDSLFTRPIYKRAGVSYTTGKFPISGKNKLFMKKTSTYDGYMKRDITAEGK